LKFTKDWSAGLSIKISNNYTLKSEGKTPSSCALVIKFDKTELAVGESNTSSLIMPLSL
jgi:hypothetical protein